MKQPSGGADLSGFRCHQCDRTSPLIDEAVGILCEIDKGIEGTPETRTYYCKFCAATNEVTLDKAQWRGLDRMEKQLSDRKTIQSNRTKSDMC